MTARVPPAAIDATNNWLLPRRRFVPSHVTPRAAPRSFADDARAGSRAVSVPPRAFVTRRSSRLAPRVGRRLASSPPRLLARGRVVGRRRPRGGGPAPAPGGGVRRGRPDGFSGDEAPGLRPRVVRAPARPRALAQVRGQAPRGAQGRGSGLLGRARRDRGGRRRSDSDLDRLCADRDALVVLTSAVPKPKIPSLLVALVSKIVPWMEARRPEFYFPEDGSPSAWTGSGRRPRWTPRREADPCAES